MLQWHKTPNVVGVPPRSIYSDQTESEAWQQAFLSARGRIHPTYVFANRRILGVTAGRGVYSPDIAVHRFRHGTSWSQMERVRNDMLHCTYPDYNAIINGLTSLQFGRTYFGKTFQTAPVTDQWYDLWPVTGTPAPGSIAGTAFTANNFTDASTGSIYSNGNVSTATKHLLSKWAYTTANTIVLMMYDRVLSYDQCTFNASVNQSMTNSNTAQRYDSGAPGLLISCVSNTVNGSTATNLTKLSYTNQAGITLQQMPTAQNIVFVPSAAAPTTTLGARVIVPTTTGNVNPFGPFLPLAPGDIGAQLIHDYTTSAANTGSFTFILMHPLSDLMIPFAGIPAETENVFQIPELERIYDGACLALMAFTTTTGLFNLTGSIKYGWA